MLAVSTCFEVTANPATRAGLTIKCAIIMLSFYIFPFRRPPKTLLFPARLEFGQEDCNEGVICWTSKNFIQAFPSLYKCSQSQWNRLLTNGRGASIVIQFKLCKLGVWWTSAVSDLGEGGWNSLLWDTWVVKELQLWALEDMGEDCRAGKEWKCLNQTTTLFLKKKLHCTSTCF